MKRRNTLFATIALAVLFITAGATGQKTLVATGETLELITNTTSIDRLPNRFSNARAVVVVLNTDSMNADHRKYDLVIKDGYAAEYDWCLGELFSFTPFDKTYTLRNQDIRVDEDQSDWIGSVQDESPSYAQFTIHQESGEVTGTIATLTTELTIRPIAGTNKHLVTEVNRSPRIGLASWSQRFDRFANKLVKRYRTTQPKRKERLLYSKLVSEHRKEVFVALHGDHFLVENPEWGGTSAIAMPDGGPFLSLNSFDPEDVIREIRDTVGPAFGWTGKEKLSLVSKHDADEDYRYVFRQANKSGVLLEHELVVSAEKTTGGLTVLLGDDIVPSWMIGLSKTKAPTEADSLQLEQIIRTYFSEKNRDGAARPLGYSMAEAPTLTAVYDRNSKQLRWKWLCKVHPVTANTNDSQSGRLLVVEAESGEVVSDLPLAPSTINIKNSTGLPYFDRDVVSQIRNDFNAIRSTSSGTPYSLLNSSVWNPVNVRVGNAIFVGHRCNDSNTEACFDPTDQRIYYRGDRVSKFVTAHDYCS